MEGRLCSVCKNRPAEYEARSPEDVYLYLCGDCIDAYRKQGFVRFSCGCKGIRLPYGDILIWPCDDDMGEKTFRLTDRFQKVGSELLSDQEIKWLIDDLATLISEGYDMQLVKGILGRNRK